MAEDANEILLGLTTTATAFNGASLDLKTTPGQLRRMNVQLLVTNISTATAGAVFTPLVSHSTDNTTFFTIGTFGSLTATTTATTAIDQLSCVPTRRYVRGELASSVTTGTPTITYRMRILQAYPG